MRHNVDPLAVRDHLEAAFLAQVLTWIACVLFAVVDAWAGVPSFWLSLAVKLLLFALLFREHWFALQRIEEEIG